MAGNGVDIAKAYVHLIPSMEGAQKTIADAIIPGASKAGDSAGKSAGSKFSGSFKSGLVALGAAAATTGAFVGLWKIADTFDKVQDTVRAGTGATGKDLEGLMDVVKNVGRNVPADFEKIGGTAADLNTRLGLTGKTLETVASQYIEAGRAMGQDIDVNKTAAAFKAFGIEGDKITGGMDALFRASQATGVGMNELASGVQKAAPALNNLGFSFEDSIALMGSLDKAGLNAEQMASSLTKSLTNLAKGGEDPADAFKRVVGELEGFVKAGDVASALDVASKIFGTRGASQFVAAMQSGVLDIENLTAAAGVTEDTILGVAKETASFGESWQLVKNNAMLALEPLASKVFTSLSTTLSDMLPTLEKFGAWLGENQWVLGVVAGVIGVTLVGAFVAWTASIWAANAALLANPITWIILAIVALVAGIVYLATQTTFFQDVWAAVWGFIQDTITNVGNFIGTVLNWISTTWATVWTFISTVASNVWSGIVGFITAYINTVKLIISTVILGIKIIWSTVWNTISTVASNVWSGIVGFISGYINTVKSIISTIMRTISSIWSGAWNGISSFVSGAWNGIIGFFSGAVGTVSGIFQNIANSIMTPFRNAFNAIAGFWNSTVGQISFKIPDWVPGVGGNGWSVPNIPMLAEGGVVNRPTLAVIGEAGPEAVIPLSKLSQHLPEGRDPGSGGKKTYIFNELSNPRATAYQVARLQEGLA